MANLLNSIVRGFGGQIGRTTANKVMSSPSYIWLALRNLLLMALFFIVIFGGLLYWANHKAPTQNSQTTEIKKDSVETHNGHNVYTGKRGGKYYYSKSGKKVYL